MLDNEWIDYETGHPVKPVATNAQRSDAGDWEDYETYKARRLAANHGAPAAVVTDAADWEPYAAPASPCAAPPASEPTDPARPVVLTRRNVLMTCRAAVGGAQ